MTKENQCKMNNKLEDPTRLKNECAAIIQWLITKKGLEKAKVIRETLTPNETYNSELANIARATMRKDWKGVYKQCNRLQTNDARKLRKRLRYIANAMTTQPTLEEKRRVLALQERCEQERRKRHQSLS